MGSTDWINLAQGRGRWQAVLNVVMNVQVPWDTWNLLSS
jgi:hypothetical protein